MLGTERNENTGIPGWRSRLAPAFGPGPDPGDPGSNPTSGSWCMEPASLSVYVSASLSLSLSVCVCVTIINKLKKFKKKEMKTLAMDGNYHLGNLHTREPTMHTESTYRNLDPKLSTIEIFSQNIPSHFL